MSVLDAPTDRSGLLIDTNLLVLYTVGTVNQSRIENFKRTSSTANRITDFSFE